MDEQPEHADPTRYAELAQFTGDWRDTWWNPDFLELCVSRLGLSAARSVLDVGSGAGHWGQLLARHLHPEVRLTGVDVKPEFAEMARTRAAEKGLADRTTYSQGAAEKLPFDDDAFDIVTCQTVLMHVKDAKVVIAEMMRVTRSGGWVVASEPDNLASTASLLNCHPRPDPKDVLALLEFQQICEAGKRALGEGDSSIGGILPGLFSRIGLQPVEVWSGDKCATLLPPYDRPDQALDLETHRGWYREQISGFTGTQHDSRRLFVAGGGEEADFGGFWKVAVRQMNAFLEATKAGEFHGARGLVGYLVAGRKPA
jgi:SAM-dependent methyltransferase